MKKRILFKKIKYIALGAVIPSVSLLFFTSKPKIEKTNVSSFLEQTITLEKALKDPALQLDKTQYILSHVPEMSAYFYVDVDTTDSIKSTLKQGIYWEGTIGNLIKKYCAYGSIAIDIGAHIGIHSITMSRKVGPSGSVISFEPQKKMYRELVHNLYENHCTNVIPIRKAVGDTHDKIHMDPINAKNEGGCAIGSGGDMAEMIPLDSLQLTGISLIKIDVERYELFVLQGMKETLLRNKPVLIFEVMGEHDYETAPPQVRKCFEDVIDYVRALGYEVQQIFGNDYIAFPLDSEGKPLSLPVASSRTSETQDFISDMYKLETSEKALW